MSRSAIRPHRVGPNQVPLYYAGGAGIDRFRGETHQGGPEDWVASVTALPPHLLPAGADAETGVSSLEDGSSLRAAVAADPIAWLGPALTAAFGGEPGLLVKLLDAGERLPVHCHPSRAFAHARLASQFGKTEGWIVLEGGVDAGMWLGFSRPVEMQQLQGWIEAQDGTAMLAAMNRLAVQPGDVLYVPAGVPHALGPGVLLVELQEPTSFSILAEYEAFGLTPAQATLGLDWGAALACFDRTAYDEVRLADLRPRPVTVVETWGGHIDRLFGLEATPFFQAYRVTVHGTLPLAPLGGFTIAIVTGGAGTLRWAQDVETLTAGQTWVVPHAAGDLELEGDLGVLLCVPPNPTTDGP